MSGIKDIADDFLSLFLPRPCLSCGAHLVRGEEVLCTGCLLAMARTDFHGRRGNMLEQVFWGRCVVERAAAFSVYNRGSRIRKLIHLLKYQGREDVGRMLGRLYGAVLAGSGFMDGIDRSDILYRTGKSGSQTRRGRYERWENVEGLFAVRKQAEIHGRHLLVVDDVITTGSTIEACVNALHDAGEVSVSVAALAVSQKLTL